MAKHSRPRITKIVGVGLVAGGLLLAAPASMALAAPGDSNGVPGQIGGSPGSYFKDAAKVPGASVKGVFGFAPGQLVKEVAQSSGGQGGPPV
jgi:hypothetical protein